MATKIWVARATECLRESLEPVPHELNELDWKLGLSAHKDRLTQHLIAFANYPDGGFLAFGIRDTDGAVEGIDKSHIDEALNTLANLGRAAIEPPVALDHAVVEYLDRPVLLVYVPEQNNKPVHRRGRPIDETWLRSGGTTRTASRQEVGGLMLNSTAPRWEDLRASPLLDLDVIVERLDLAAVAALLKKPLPEAPDEIARWLVEESMIVADGRGYFITNFGAIAAAKRLEDFDALKRKRIRVIRIGDLTRLKRSTNYQGRKATQSVSKG